LADLQNAVAQQELAVRLTPEDSAAWLAMAQLYEVHGNSTGAIAARQRAAALQSPAAVAPASDNSQR
jgi:Tfp pilus assembly protein PilF